MQVLDYWEAWLVFMEDETQERVIQIWTIEPLEIDDLLPTES